MSIYVATPFADYDGKAAGGCAPGGLMWDVSGEVEYPQSRYVAVFAAEDAVEAETGDVA